MLDSDEIAAFERKFVSLSPSGLPFSLAKKSRR